MSEKLFDDLTLKEELGSVNLKLRAEKNISTWQATRFISDLNTSYYKIELLDSIANAINNGIKPENILILNRSLNICNVYSKMNCISENNIALLYAIGLPYSLVPSERALNTRFIFIYFRIINEVLRKYKLERNATKELPFYIKYANEKSLEEAIELLKSKTLERNQTEKVYEKLKEDFEKKSQSIEKNYGFEKLIIKKDDKNALKEEKGFVYYFNQIKRPIVIAFDDELKSGRVLCRNQLNRNAENDTTFNLKSVKHNSPFTFDIAAGISIITLVCKGIKEAAKLAKEMKLKNLEIESKELDNQIKRVQLERELSSNQIELLKNQIVKDELKLLQESVKERCERSAKLVKMSVVQDNPTENPNDDTENP